jgi:hypothetical protein
VRASPFRSPIDTQASLRVRKSQQTKGMHKSIWRRVCSFLVTSYSSVHFEVMVFIFEFCWLTIPKQKYTVADSSANGSVTLILRITSEGASTR